MVKKFPEFDQYQLGELCCLPVVELHDIVGLNNFKKFAFGNPA